MPPDGCARIVERTMPRRVAKRTFDRIWDVGVGERREIVDRNGKAVA